MKKLVSAICVLAAAVAFAGVKNTMISFSTLGPDKYADGTTVLDGECYALVYTPNGSQFAGILADGTAAAPSKLVLAAPVAKDGKCPTVVFQLDEDIVAKEYANGTFGVYLLDTRLTKNGKVTVGLNAQGKPQTVATFAKVGDAATSGGIAAVSGSVGAPTASGLPAEAAGLKIKSVKVDGAYVYITATGTVPYLQYGVLSGETPDALKDVTVTPQAGAADPNAEVILVTPKSGDTGFFQVNRK